jgi:MFS family permease
VGILADRYGRRRILVPSLFLFGIAGGACALTKSFTVLIILRVFQGVGAAALGSLNMTLLGDLYSGDERAAAMGYNASVLNVGVAVYPLIGGAMAALAWNYPFFLAFLGIPIGLLVLFSLNNPEPRSKQSIAEYLGGVWGYLKNIKIISAFMAMVFSFIVLYGPYLTYLSLFLDDSFGASSVVIGLMLSSYAIVAAVVASQLGRMVKVMTLANLIKLGFVFQGVSLILLPFMPRVELVLVSTFVYGIGSGIFIPSILTYVAGAAPAEYRAAFMSLNGASLRLGQTLGPLIAGLLYTHIGFTGMFLAGAGLSLAVAAIGFIGGRIVR